MLCKAAELNFHFSITKCHLICKPLWHRSPPPVFLVYVPQNVSLKFLRNSQSSRVKNVLIIVKVVLVLYSRVIILFRSNFTAINNSSEFFVLRSTELNSTSSIYSILYFIFIFKGANTAYHSLVVTFTVQGWRVYYVCYTKKIIPLGGDGTTLSIHVHTEDIVTPLNKMYKNGRNILFTGSVSAGCYLKIY